MDAVILQFLAKLLENGSIQLHQGYGGKEEIQQIKEANEKREQKELESASEEGKAIVQTDLPQQGGQSATMESPESAETRRFVICPKCGEQIWL